MNQQAANSPYQAVVTNNTNKQQHVQTSPKSLPNYSLGLRTSLWELYLLKGKEISTKQLRAPYFGDERP